MVTLNKYVPAWGLSDFSPFCVKVETYLRMTKVPFRVVVADGRKAPKQKLPVIEDGGKIVCDSRDIIDHGAEEIDKRLCQALDAVSFQLGDGPYFFGARPRVIDATVYAFVASMLDTPFESGSRSYGRGLENLTACRARMRGEYFADRAAA
jgi:glutathione S-transferase